VKVGQIVKVRVLEVNEQLKRITLSMKSPPRAAKPAAGKKAAQPKPKPASIQDLMARFNPSKRRGVCGKSAQ
jgi:uncharacterized protein